MVKARSSPGTWCATSSCDSSRLSFNRLAPLGWPPVRSASSGLIGICLGRPPEETLGFGLFVVLFGQHGAERRMRALRSGRCRRCRRAEQTIDTRPVASRAGWGSRPSPIGGPGIVKVGAVADFEAGFQQCSDGFRANARRMTRWPRSVSWRPDLGVTSESSRQTSRRVRRDRPHRPDGPNPTSARVTSVGCRRATVLPPAT